MQLVLDIIYGLFFVTCLVLAYRGCQQDLKSIKHIQKVYKVKNKIKSNESKKYVPEPHSTVSDDPPSYSDVVG